MATSENLSVVNTMCISSFLYTHVITFRKLRLKKCGDWRRRTAKMKCDTKEIMEVGWLYKNGSEFELKSCCDSSVSYSVWTGLTGCWFKSNSDQLSKAISENASVEITICISSFCCTDVITYRKLGLNKRCNWRRQTFRNKMWIKQTMILEWLCKVDCECELKSWPDSSVS